MSGVAAAGPKKGAKAEPPAPATAAAATPSAPAGPQEKQGISHVLGFLDWGAASQEVLASLKKEVDARHAEQMKELRDPLEIDKALRRKAVEFAAIEKTLVQFSGQRTGYESSLIANDFVPGAEESMIRIDDQEAQRYFFFKNDRLWKVLVAYSSSVSRSTPFGDFVKQVQDKYGRPLDVESSNAKGGAKTMIRASWEDPITRLVVEDRTEFFGTYCMKFLDKAVGVPLETERLANAPTKTKLETDPSVDAALTEITSGGGGDDNVVDRLTGSDHSVDIARNRPDYETSLNRGQVDSPTFPREEAAPKKGGKAKGKGKVKPAAAGKPEKPAERPANAPIIY